MEGDTPTAQDLLALLRQYEDACNRYDIEAAVAMFAEDGYIEIYGTQHRGQAVLYAAHEFDMGSQTQVTFRDGVVSGDTVSCTFITCDVLDRAVGLDGRYMQAEFTFRNGRIARFLNLPANEQERQRHHEAKHAFHVWAREHYPGEVAKGANFDYEAGASLTRVVHEWLKRHPHND